MEPQEEIEYYRDTLEGGLNLICESLGVSSEFYDRDQANGECYLDCFRDAAKVIEKSGFRWDDDEADFLRKMNKYLAVFHQWHVHSRGFRDAVIEAASEDEAYKEAAHINPLKDHFYSSDFHIVELEPDVRVCRRLSWRERLAGRINR